MSGPSLGEALPLVENRGGYRGSVNRGDANASAKLSNEDAARIRRQYLEGHSTAARIAEKYGVGPSAVKRLLLGVSFHDAGGPTFTRLVTFQEWSWGCRPKDYVKADEKADTSAARGAL